MFELIVQHPNGRKETRIFPDKEALQLYLNQNKDVRLLAGTKITLNHA